MVQIQLIPTLDHCIETTARKEYQRLVQEYLAGKGTADFEEKAELLRTFLESADFRKLRRESEAELLQGKKVIFTLYREGNETKYNMTVS
ncbi:MAG: hypothetical protein FJ008_03030 [Chloroflexi bacterium]|nr:hypothetical protein [Chloroflexota bacterium]MBM3154286.1 hypothetical protein [Chloroflexota bacterium]MBM3172613.1 hypothetical protein [Chloroflexota bacterium]MBM3174617.1 hypothetical protein [Chloroflexota bacterium]MBM4449546.1 hypothetical protein [Chloroflexota bacterium]